MNEPTREETERALRNLGVTNPAPTNEEITDGMASAVSDGLMEVVGVGEDGELQYRLTEAGRERAIEVIRANQGGAS
jgi:hypothetical protein